MAADRLRAIVPLTVGSYVWIPGAHAKFLAELPKWNGPPLSEQMPAKTGLLGALRRDFVHVVLLVIGIGATIALAIMFRQ